jgi:hypothetical protein
MIFGIEVKFRIIVKKQNNDKEKSK